MNVTLTERKEYCVEEIRMVELYISFENMSVR